MPHDLTPQLRTRLNRVERAVGIFVILATLFLLIGFGFFIYHTAETRGWFAIKARYYTYVSSGAGLQVGDRVTMLGFPAGQITSVKPMAPFTMPPDQAVYVEFVVMNENYGYLWTEGSAVRFSDSGFLGKRELDLTTGTNGYATYLANKVRLLDLETIRQSPNLEKLDLGEEIYDGTNLVLKARVPVAKNLDRIAALGRTNLWIYNSGKPTRSLSSMWNSVTRRYEPVTAESKYELPRQEAPSISDRIQGLIAQIQGALPGVLNLTNQVASTLSNVSQLTGTLNVVASEARVTVTNLAVITAQLRNPKGSLGEWIIPTNINLRLDSTLSNTDLTMLNVDTNLQNLNTTLINLGNITSNLNLQVQANSNMLTGINNTVVHSDEFIQGLKKFWLFKHTFATQKPKSAATNRPPSLGSPKDNGARQP
jgi:hypothetical protein